MAFPNATLVFYRLPDTVPTNTAISDLLDAVYNALIQTTDFRGNSVPASCQWPWTRFTVAGPVTEAVYTTGIPTGCPLTQTPRFILAGAAGAKTPAMLVDTTATSVIHIGMNLRSGVFSAWDNSPAVPTTPLIPFTSGQFSGYCKTTAAAANTLTTKVRAYVSAEAIFIDIIQNNVSHYWMYFGAIIEPWSSDTVNCAETDNHVYGMITGGSAVIGSSWQNGIAANDWLTHGAANGNSHGHMFIPGTANSLTSGMYSIESEFQWKRVSGVDQPWALDDSCVNRPIFMGRTSSKAPVGRLREMYLVGAVVGGTTGFLLTDDLVHYISVDLTSAQDGLALRSV